MREIATGLQFPEGPIALDDGSVILVEIKRGTLSRVFPDGRIQVVAECGGGPNGAALGPDGRVYVCNNGGFTWDIIDGFSRPTGTPDDYVTGSIQAVDISSGDIETIYTACDGEALCGPNDIVFDSHGGFYFTDLGKRTERTMDRGAIYYANTDGSLIRRLVAPFETPNGIGLSPDEKTLYVAETIAGNLRYYRIEAPGVLMAGNDPWHVGDILYSFTGVDRLDSLAVDSEGSICIATLGSGCVTAISANGELRAAYPVPVKDIMVTNVCFGGRDLQTAYVTSSGLGKLYATEWHCPGHPLNFNPY